MYRNSHKQKITLATDSCSEGDFDKRGAFEHPPFYFFPFLLLSPHSIPILCRRHSNLCFKAFTEITRIINADHIRNLGHIKFSGFY